MQSQTIGQREETRLRIHLIETNDPMEIFPTPLVEAVPDTLKHLELSNFGVAEIITFEPQDHMDLTKVQRIFLRRMQDVVMNMLDSNNRIDLYAQDLADCLIQECRLDDGGTRLYGRFSRLTLRIGNEKHVLLADREGRKRSGELVWVLQHGKHRLNCQYKHGDIHMVASLIAACQENFARNRGRLTVKVLYGIKVVGEELFLYSVNFRDEYLKQIAEKLPSIDLIAYKYPSTTGLRITKQDDRKTLLCLLHIMRECCISNAHF
ncbi:hypothetical protein KP509_15G070900 [Ceratopteris richardii]|uniref:Uncharacterized protein n=1 Tax=Ceratopteris richardii TaxID=49495 RepID=A0A8T2T6V4_CERRI|nr:hypothetical protein KP509_15G070900 [Ceratopteris richardii]KAH7405450.1 hypothetical protein KP509_15G070900 [Ceratopteris richardii]KAH7405451.1 hypothetical protein KP509_15G070900 [Ceratopteris richardii]KAH7405452.1 hypothetical protein KP509_15G070900 [Ceratopteris richardii]